MKFPIIYRQIERRLKISSWYRQGYPFPGLIVLLPKKYARNWEFNVLCSSSIEVLKLRWMPLPESSPRCPNFTTFGENWKICTTFFIIFDYFVGGVQEFGTDIWSSWTAHHFYKSARAVWKQSDVTEIFVQ